MPDTYTPTTEEILRGFTAPAYKVEPRREGERFAEWLLRLSVDSFHAQVQSEDAARRWLARHDAETAAKALRDFVTTGKFGREFFGGPTKDMVVAWAEEEAARLSSGGEG